MQFYGEYDSRTNGRNDVGDDQRPVFKHDSLDNEKHAASAQRQKGGSGYTVGIAGTYCGNGLRQIAEHHADGGKIAYYCYKHFRICHKKEVVYRINKSAYLTVLRH